MIKYYKEDLAFIHDVGHSAFALKSAPGILEILRRSQIRRGLVVDLGCGSGLFARELLKAGYQVLGIDCSAAMIGIARKKAPHAKFQIRSMFKIPIPACKAVTSIGECLNYLFDSDYSKQRLMPLFQRVYRALDIGGVFIFDIAEPGQIGADIVRGFSEGGDWVVLAEKQEDRGRERLRRRITSFRKVGKHYRRAEEVHHLQLYAAADIVKQLRTVGFSVQTTRSYGSFSLPRAHVAFVAHKPVC